VNAYAVSYVDEHPTEIILADRYEADLFDLTFIAGRRSIRRVPIESVATVRVRSWSWVATAGSSPEQLQQSVRDGAWRMDRDLRVAT
jgi:hypothetical protein